MKAPPRCSHKEDRCLSPDTELKRGNLARERADEEALGLKIEHDFFAVALAAKPVTRDDVLKAWANYHAWARTKV